MSSILEAVSKGTDLKHFNERKERVPNNFDAKKADNDLRACPVCKVVWEVMIFNQTIDRAFIQTRFRLGPFKEYTLCKYHISR